MSAEGGSKKPTTKGRYVPSRYKQAARKVADQASRMDFTSRQIALQVDQQFLSSTIQGCNSDVTEMNLKCSDGKYFQSTPASSFLQRPANNVYDISAVEQTMCEPVLKGNLFPKEDMKVKRPLKYGGVQRAPLVVPPTEKNINEFSGKEDPREDLLDIVYAQYLQSAFLESEAKKALELRSKDAFESIHRVWSLIQVLMEKDKAYNKELDTISYVKNLHKKLCKQEQMLEPILELFPTLLNKYKTLSEAIDSVRHKLPVSGILPLDSSMEDEIISLLSSFEVSLKSFLSLLPEEDSLSSSANSFSTLASVTENTNQEIKRCTDLLSTVDDLMLNETSLAMSKQQLKQEPN